MYSPHYSINVSFVIFLGKNLVQIYDDNVGYYLEWYLFNILELHNFSLQLGKIYDVTFIGHHTRSCTIYNSMSTASVPRPAS